MSRGSKLYVVLAEFRAKRDRVDGFAAFIGHHARSSVMEEEGCLIFDVCRDPIDPVVFLLYEVYKDEAAYRLHRQTEYYARFRREAPAMLETEDGELYHLPPRAAAPMAGGGVLKQERRNRRRETCPMSS